MLSLSQQIQAGMVLYGLCKRHALVRGYVSLLLKMAPARYKQLLNIKRMVASLFVLMAVCAICGRN